MNSEGAWRVVGGTGPFPAFDRSRCPLPDMAAQNPASPSSIASASASARALRRMLVP